MNKVYYEDFELLEWHIELLTKIKEKKPQVKDELILKQKKRDEYLNLCKDFLETIIVPTTTKIKEDISDLKILKEYIVKHPVLFKGKVNDVDYFENFRNIENLVRFTENNALFGICGKLSNVKDKNKYVTDWGIYKYVKYCSYDYINSLLKYSKNVIFKNSTFEDIIINDGKFLELDNIQSNVTEEINKLKYEWDEYLKSNNISFQSYVSRDFLQVKLQDGKIIQERKDHALKSITSVSNGKKLYDFLKNVVQKQVQVERSKVKNIVIPDDMENNNNNNKENIRNNSIQINNTIANLADRNTDELFHQYFKRIDHLYKSKKAAFINTLFKNPVYKNEKDQLNFLIHHYQKNDKVFNIGIREFLRLRQNKCLSSFVIDFFGEMIMSENSTVFYYAFPFVELVSSNSKDSFSEGMMYDKDVDLPLVNKLLLGINYPSNEHFSLFYADVIQKIIYFLNPMNDCGDLSKIKKYADSLIKYFEYRFKIIFTFEILKCIQQTNGNDCGVYTILFMDLISKGLFNYVFKIDTKGDSSLKYRMFLAIILKKGFLGDIKPLNFQGNQAFSSILKLKNSSNGDTHWVDINDPDQDEEVEAKDVSKYNQNDETTSLIKTNTPNDIETNINSNIHYNQNEEVEAENVTNYDSNKEISLSNNIENIKNPKTKKISFSSNEVQTNTPTINFIEFSHNIKKILIRSHILSF